MRRKIDRRHTAFLQHTLIVHHAVVLAAIATGGVQKQDVLVSFSRLLVEDFATAPCGRSNVDVSPDDMIVIALWLFICRCRTYESIVEDLEHAAPDLRPRYGQPRRMMRTDRCKPPLSKLILISLDRDTLLFDVLRIVSFLLGCYSCLGTLYHAEHA